MPVITLPTGQDIRTDEIFQIEVEACVVGDWYVYVTTLSQGRICLVFGSEAESAAFVARLRNVVN